MYPAVQCYLLIPTTKVDRRLRCYSSITGSEKCPVWGTRHDGSVFLDIVEDSPDISSNEHWPREDPRWPTKCDCGYLFDQNVTKQLFCEHLWKRVDNGQETRLRDATPGVMYDAHWMHDWKDRCGSDGKCLHVICPNGRTWCIDSRASNCTMPNDTVHRCWIRHGEAPNLTVDKSGATCAAGAGSIQAGDYHGYLQNGILTAG